MVTRLGLHDAFDRAERIVDETSDEAFDRTAFALRALDLVNPGLTIAVCEGGARLRVESGPIWGQRNRRWALLAVPPKASKRAIALAVAELTPCPRAYALDVLMDEASRTVLG
jgi:hypothetical protein